MSSGPITSWQIDGEKVETVADFISWAPITSGVDCSDEIKRHMLLGRKALTNPESILKIKDITLLTKVPIVKPMLFFPRSHIPVWEFDHKESRVPKNWCIQMWCWRRLLRVSWTIRRSNHLILKEINSEYSLESSLGDSEGWKPDMLQSMGSQRVRHDLGTKQQ